MHHYGKVEHTGHEQPQTAWLDVPQLAQEFEAIGGGHLIVDNGGIEGSPEGFLEGFGAVLGLFDLVSVAVQHGSQRLPECGIVVDDQNACHVLSSLTFLYSASGFSASVISANEPCWNLPDETRR